MLLILPRKSSAARISGTRATKQLHVIRDCGYGGRVFQRNERLEKSCVVCVRVQQREGGGRALSYEIFLFVLAKRNELLKRLAIADGRATGIN